MWHIIFRMLYKECYLKKIYNEIHRNVLNVLKSTVKDALYEHMLYDLYVIW